MDHDLPQRRHRPAFRATQPPWRATVFYSNLNLSILLIFAVIMGLGIFLLLLYHIRLARGQTITVIQMVGRIIPWWLRIRV
jgi:hypothetical protein